MSNDENSATSPPPGPQAKPGFWQAVKRMFIRTEAELSYFKGLTFVGLLSTLIVAYFQYLTAYEGKVATQAQDDLTAAAQTFADISSALSVPLSLQERLIFGYYAAVDQAIDHDDKAYVTQSARTLNAPYEDAYTALRQNINYIAQKVEIYLDWPSDTSRDPAINIPPNADPISVSALGTYNFNCDANMPAFDDKNRRLALSDPNNSKNTLIVDWYSAKHNVLTIYYCFYVTHELMKPLREWAANSNVDAAGRTKFIGQEDAIKNRLDKQVLRLNAFMGLAMNEIEQIRVKYRPNGFICSVPGVGQLLSLVSNRCTPVRTAGP